ncbi:MAG TPA: pilus assembly protein TadG-related protein [Candidatus Cybelea sp.]|nr:pilus assembly protein TadG-related protein [Candidatus Cybelea sp.]
MTRNREAGQSLAFVAVGLVALMGFAGLAIDMGALRYDKRVEQTAADAAAIAGASNLAYGGVLTGALAASASNGFSAASAGNGCPPPAPATAVGSVAVSINNPPCSGPHNGDSNYVEVYVSEVQPTFFMRVFGVNSETITARAVATNVSAGAGSGCLYTVGTSGYGILMNGTNETINGPPCGIVDNASLLMNGSNDSITAGSIGVSGSATENGTATASPKPITGMPAGADPLAYLNSSAPSPASCRGSAKPVIINGRNPEPQMLPPGDYCGGIMINGTNTVTVGAGVFSGIMINGTGNNVTLSPGTYGRITIDGSNANVTFNSGLYIINGNAGFVDNGSNLTLSGTGVTFYSTADAGPITLDGSGLTANLSAPTSGADVGMLLWQAPGDSNTITLNGNTSTSLNGIVYAPSAQVTINGRNAVTPYFVLVTKNLLMNGASTLNLDNDASGFTGGSPIKDVTLVE